jgi:hypothetical protein
MEKYNLPSMTVNADMLKASSVSAGTLSVTKFDSIMSRCFKKPVSNENQENTDIMQ